MATCVHFPEVLEQNFWHLLYLNQQDTHTLSPRHSLSLSPLSLSPSPPFYLSISLFPSLPPSLSLSLSLSPSFSLPLPLSLSLSRSPSPFPSLSLLLSSLTHTRTHPHAPHLSARVQMIWRCARNNRTCFLLPMPVFSVQTTAARSRSGDE